MTATERASKNFSYPVAGGITLTDDDVKILRATGVIPEGTTQAEVEYFKAQVQRSQLDPFARQILPMRRKSWNSETRTNEYKMTVLTSIDGFRLIAERTGDYAGQQGPFWCGTDGKWTDVWLQNTPPAAAKVGVLRHGFKEPLFSVALWDAYKQETNQGALMGRWKVDPAGMLAKCAEALALRRAFPNEMSGLYTADEMAQAGAPVIDTPKDEPPSLVLAAAELGGQVLASDGPTAEGNPAVRVTAALDLKTASEPEVAAFFGAEPEEPPLDPSDMGEPPSPGQGTGVQVSVPTMGLDTAKTVAAGDGRPYAELTLGQLEKRQANLMQMLQTPNIEPDVRDDYLYRLSAVTALIPWRLAEGDPQVTKTPSTPTPKAKAAAKKQAASVPVKTDDLVKMAETDPVTAFWMLGSRAKLNGQQLNEVKNKHAGDFSAAFTDLLVVVRAE